MATGALIGPLPLGNSFMSITYERDHGIFCMGAENACVGATCLDYIPRYRKELQGSMVANTKATFVAKGEEKRVEMGGNGGKWGGGRGEWGSVGGSN